MNKKLIDLDVFSKFVKDLIFKLNGKAPTNHSHQYAGSSEIGGSANSAVKLDVSAGAENQPVYFKDGKPVKTKYELNATVPANAKFTEYTSKPAVSDGTDVSLVTTGEKAIWNAKTSNAGTITGIKMNGTSKGSTGVVDLGTVLTSGSQTTTSNTDGGSNVYTFSDGSTITVKNGSKGSTGANGTTPTIKVAAGSNIGTVGTPSVTASTSGTTTTFTFNNLKGAKGDPGVNATTTAPFTGATTSAAGKTGLVPAPSTGAANRYLRSDGTWVVPPDTNTTYTAGTGISLSGTAFSNSGVRSITSGTTKGTISVNTNGTSAEVAVKGLGSAAYTASTAYATSGHTHNYAGSSAAGGSATTAVALTSKNIGSNVVPVYFDADGKPVVCKYTLGDASTKTIKTSTAVSSAAWVNLATGQKYIPDMAFISYWNGAVNDQGGSNLKYCNKGAFGTAATKGVDTDVTSGSANLVTSGGVSTALASYKPDIVKKMNGTDGKEGYICFARLTITKTYSDSPIEFTLIRRNSSTPCKVSIKFVNTNSVDPNLESLVVMGENYEVYAYKPVASTWDLYAKKSGASDSITLIMVNDPQHGIDVIYPGTQINAKHNASPLVDATWGYKVGTANNSIQWNGFTNDINTNNTTGTYLLVANGNKIQHRLSTSFAPSSHSHSAATTSAAGYMSAADKTKLNGIATGANNYSLPTASSTLGGVKTTSTVTSTSGLTACPIISGVPYYKNTTYSSLKNPHAITLQGNGTTLTNGVYDGSVAKTVNITPANIGACKATDGIVNNSFKVTKASGATLTTTAAADKITMSTDKKLFIGDDSGFASSTKIYGTFDHAQTVLYSSTSSSTLTSVSIANLFTEYSLIFINIQGSKTYHSHVVPLKYLKSKRSIIFKDAGSSSIIPLNLLYVSDTEMRWFEYQGQGTETYSAVQVIKIY